MNKSRSGSECSDENDADEDQQWQKEVDVIIINMPNGVEAGTWTTSQRDKAVAEDYKQKTLARLVHESYMEYIESSSKHMCRDNEERHRNLRRSYDVMCG